MLKVLKTWGNLGKERNAIPRGVNIVNIMLNKKTTLIVRIPDNLHNVSTMTGIKKTMEKAFPNHQILIVPESIRFETIEERDGSVEQMMEECASKLIDDEFTKWEEQSRKKAFKNFSNAQFSVNGEVIGEVAEFSAVKYTAPSFLGSMRFPFTE